MAKLALSLAGAAAGFAVGGPTGARLGFMAGQVAGGLLFPTQGQEQVIEGNRLGDLVVTSATVGMSLPLIIGAGKVGANVFYSENIVEHRSESSQRSGGKGGGGGQTTTTVSYSYSVTMACSICEGPMAEVLKIVFQDTVLFDASVDNQLPGGITYYDGSETQIPDPTMEATLGAGNVPAFRGTAYLVFEGVDITAWGQIPNITVTVADSVAVTVPVGAVGLGRPSTLGKTIVGSTNSDTAYYVSSLSELRSVDTGLNTGAVSFPLDNPISGAGFRHISDVQWTNPPTESGADVLLMGVYNASTNIRYGGLFWYRISDGLTREFTVNTVKVNGGDPDYRPLAVSSDDNGAAYYLCGGASPNNTTLRYWAVTGIGVVSSHETVDPATVTFADFQDYSETMRVIGTKSGLIYLGGDDGVSNFLKVVQHSTSTGFSTSNTILKDSPIRVIRDTGSAGYVFLLFDNRVERVGTLGHLLQTYPMLHVMKDMEVRDGVIVVTRLATADVDTFFVSTGASLDTTSLLTTGTDPYYEGLGSLIAPMKSGIGHYLITDDEPKFSPVATDDYFVYVQSDVSTAEDTNVAAVLSVICDKAGVTPDLSLLNNDPLRGYTLSGRTGLNNHLEGLAKVYLFGVADGEVPRFVSYGGNSLVTVPEGALAASPLGSTAPPRLSHERVAENSLPRTLTYGFLDDQREYEQVSVPAPRFVTTSNQEAVEGYAIASGNDDMSNRVVRALYHRWAARDLYSVYVPWSYSQYEETDIITIESKGISREVRVVQAELGANNIIRLSCVSTNKTAYTLTGAAQAELATSPAPLITTPDTELRVLDVPLLLDTNADAPGYYVLVSAVDDTTTSKWRGARVHRSLDSTTYTTLIDIGSRGIFGTVVVALPNAPQPDLFDYANTISVVLNSGTLESITEDAVLAGGNALALGTDATGYEVVQYATATLTAPLSYDLTGLLRGRKGTDWRMGQHEAQEQAVFLSTQSMFRIDDNITNAAATQYFKPVSVGNDIVGVPAQTFVNDLVSLKPYSPVHLAGSVGINKEWVLTWVRRARINAVWANGPDAPLDEPIESYDVEIMSGLTVVRTVTVDENTPVQAGLNPAVASFTYDEVMQIADFGSVVSSVSFNVYQNSSRIGRGYVASAVV